MMYTVTMTVTVTVTVTVTMTVTWFAIYTYENPDQSEPQSGSRSAK